MNQISKENALPKMLATVYRSRFIAEKALRLRWSLYVDRFSYAVVFEPNNKIFRIVADPDGAIQEAQVRKARLIRGTLDELRGPSKRMVNKVFRVFQIPAGKSMTKKQKDNDE